MNGWHWQDDARWQSCSDAARQQADAWMADSAAHHTALIALANQQPLTDDGACLAEAMDHAAALQRVSQQLVVIGTGGASLGAQAFCALSADPSRVRFLENCDPVTIERFFKLSKESTSWCIISKSGETVETLATALALVGHYGTDVLLRDRVRVITASTDSTLGRLATAQGWKILTHPAALGGRYSVFSIVGMLPAAYAGLPVDKMLAKASACRNHFVSAPDATLLAHAVWLAANIATKPMHVLMAYADRLRPATQWYKQLWAESLGKDSTGATPVTAIGAIDQHSQLQLYLDGPRDKLVTLWLPDVRGVGSVLPKQHLAGLEFLGGHAMGDVMQATAEATVTTMVSRGVPLRVLRGALTAESLAGWMVRQMMETLLVAHLLKVDPYSQPAVEQGKKLTRTALTEAV